MIEYNFNFESNKGSLVATYAELIQFLQNLDLYKCESDTYYNYKAIVAKSIENAIENKSFLTNKEGFKIEVETFNLFIIYTICLFNQIKKSKDISKYEKYYFEEITSQIYLCLERKLSDKKNFKSIYNLVEKSKMDFSTYNLDYIEKLTITLNDEVSLEAREKAFKDYVKKLVKFPQTKAYYETT